MNCFNCCSIAACIFSKLAMSLLPRVLINAKDFYPGYSQKQPSIGVLMKNCSENMQQIYKLQHSLWSVISIKLQNNFTKIAPQHRCSPVNLQHTFRTNFPKNTSVWLLLYDIKYSKYNFTVKKNIFSQFSKWKWLNKQKDQESMILKILMWKRLFIQKLCKRAVKAEKISC